MISALDPFDDAVNGDGVDDQTAAQSFDRLVMRRIDLCLISPDNLLQQGMRLDGYSMAALYGFSALLVFLGARHLSVYILEKAAAEDDVDRLGAAANA